MNSIKSDNQSISFTFLKTFATCLILIVIISCEQKKEPVFEVKVEKKGRSYQYIIYKDKRSFIRQDHIPSIQGERIFRFEEDARNTANLMIDKLKKGQMPSVNQKELDSMKVAY